jgi:hypothetical protein
MITKELSQPFDVITPVTMKLTAYTKPIHQLHLSTRHAGDPPAEVRHRLWKSLVLLGIIPLGLRSRQIEGQNLLRSSVVIVHASSYR